MCESLLRKYRANPSNANFGLVEKVYRPWLTNIAFHTLSIYKINPISVIDDLVNEGLISIYTSCRRFLWVCKNCCNVFIQYNDLKKHAMEKYKTIGKPELIKLTSFIECSAKLTIRRETKRLLNQEIPCDVNLMNSDWSEENFTVEIMIKRAEKKMSDDAKEILNKILCANNPSKISHTKAHKEIYELLYDIYMG